MRTGTSFPVTESDAGPDFWDADGNLEVAPADVLFVINLLRRRSVTGEGEQAPAVSSAVSVQVASPIETREERELDELLVDEAQVLATPSERVIDASLEDWTAAEATDLIVAEDKDDSPEDRVAALDIAFGDLI